MNTKNFWDKVNKDGPIPAHKPELGPCWLWTANRNKNGYGRVWRDGKLASAHKVAYEITHSVSITAPMECCHHCDNPPCVNPAHLFVGTKSENQKDSVLKKRHVNSKKTVCLRGHELTGSNVLVNKNGHRKCRQCFYDQRATRAIAKEQGIE